MLLCGGVWASDLRLLIVYFNKLMGLGFLVLIC